MAGGRPSKYETDVKPRFNDIKKWASLGVSEKDIAKNLGVAYNTFLDYKRKFPEFLNLVKDNRKQPVEEIKAAMLKRALGFQYVEIEETDDEKDGYKKRTVTRTALPDVTAGIYLLKHWAKEEGWTTDPQTLELKKQELKLKEENMKKEDW